MERMFKHDLDNRLIWSWGKSGQGIILKNYLSSLLSLFGTITRCCVSMRKRRRLFILLLLTGNGIDISAFGYCNFSEV